MVSPVLQGPISELTRRYQEVSKEGRDKRRKARKERGEEVREWYREAYEWLANESVPEAKGPLLIGLKLAPRLVAPLYLGSKLGKIVGTAGAEGAFGSGPVAGLDYTPEIAQYERSALGSSRII